MTTVLLSAGDASGDRHAADFVRALHALRPDCLFAGLGGIEMSKAGVRLVSDPHDLAVGGLVEVSGSFFRLARAWRRLAAEFDRRPPDLVVLVDSGGFNVPFARHVRRRSDAPVLYYVAPQVWAWRARRMKKIAARVDRVAVILPFEQRVWESASVRTDWVGHPLVDPLRVLARELDRDAARSLLGVSSMDRIVTLLPGSRRNEIEHQLPAQLEAARILHARDARIGFLLPCAPGISKDRLKSLLRVARLPSELAIVCVDGRAREAIRAADVVLAKPGTVTVEAMLLERPMVVMGRANALSAAIARRALRVRWLAMPNLIAGRPIVPELLQQRASGREIADALLPLFEGPSRKEQLERLAEASRRLGPGGSAARVARLAEEMIDSAAP